MGFRAPLDDISFALRRVADLEGEIAAGVAGELTDDLADAIVGEAARFGEEVLAPLNVTGDKTGAKFSDGTVTTPPGWKEAYRDFAAAGWTSLVAPTEYGGQGLPFLLNMAVQDIFNASNPAFITGSMLSIGAVHAIDEYGTSELKELWLPRIVSGEWTATMNLTEPHAGTDLGAMRTKAEPRPDGSYRLFGQKIFITYGDHDLTDNIVHLVLARLPDAPQGSQGISMFLVPKRLLNDDGSLGATNDVVCGGIEHKLGLHGSPTCTMLYGSKGEGAVGWMVGEPNRGLQAMFLMMNRARVTVGLQGVGVAERAYQHALDYARERKQGRPIGKKGDMVPIIEHPDIERHLIDMKAKIAAGRAVCYACAEAEDRSRAGTDEEKSVWSERVALLTPVAKAFSTDLALEVTQAAVQVHGGAGYIEETGVAQYYRDARVFAIYEGTNGIQAIDLVMRKLPLAQGGAITRFGQFLREQIDLVAASNDPAFGHTAEILKAALEDLTETTKHLLGLLIGGKYNDALAGATPYLRLFGLAASGTLIAAGAAREGRSGASNPARVALARYFAENHVGQTASLRTIVTDGAASLFAANERILAKG
jgi:alkylation response protein AidB-like acyl-CoA dehydrogenase